MVALMMSYDGIDCLITQKSIGDILIQLDHEKVNRSHHRTQLRNSNENEEIAISVEQIIQHWRGCMQKLKSPLPLVQSTNSEFLSDGG